jgi:hypothetical protein
LFGIRGSANRAEVLAIRGNIDFVSRTRVEGWIYCASFRSSEFACSPFVDDECVGAAIIELFRQNLVGGKIGDGVAGSASPSS